MYPQDCDNYKRDDFIFQTVSSIFSHNSQSMCCVMTTCCFHCCLFWNSAIVQLHDGGLWILEYGQDKAVILSKKYIVPENSWRKYFCFRHLLFPYCCKVFLIKKIHDKIFGFLSCSLHSKSQQMLAKHILYHTSIMDMCR